jgi:hypothetical protein
MFSNVYMKVCFRMYPDGMGQEKALNFVYTTEPNSFPGLVPALNVLIHTLDLIVLSSNPLASL